MKNRKGKIENGKQKTEKGKSKANMNTEGPEDIGGHGEQLGGRLEGQP